LKKAEESFHPIIILGAARSGTTLLAETVLSNYSEISYWNEPNFIWTYGNAYRKEDVFHAQDATSKVKKYITSRFLEYMQQHQGKRFMEKTPANVFRVPFILTIFPDAQIIHVIRDGRDVALSASHEWIGKGGDALDSQKLRKSPLLTKIIQTTKNELQLRRRVRDLTSFFDLFALSGRYFRFIQRQIFHSNNIIWGPRFPGIYETKKTHSLLETCALQWEHSVTAARSACTHLPKDQYIELRYEDLIDTPNQEIEKILSYLNLHYDEQIISELSSNISQERTARWKAGLSNKELQKIEGLVGSTLSLLGYV